MKIPFFSSTRPAVAGTKVTLTLSGLHCTSCAINIDGALEDTKGVMSAQTQYASSKVDIVYDPEQVSVPELVSVIRQQGYQVTA